MAMKVCVAPNDKSLYSKDMTEYGATRPRPRVFGKYLLILCMSTGFCFFPQTVFSQDSAYAVPDSLRRPERGEAPRYAEDFVIGELGRGEASEAAYIFASGLLSTLTSWRSSEPLPERFRAIQGGNVLDEIRSINARTFRIGGGRTEADGCVSFLARFIGQEESIAGELFLRYEGGSWLLDDLALEEKRSLSEIRDGYRFNFSPYERFF